jgi:hypothetical protein
MEFMASASRANHAAARAFPKLIYFGGVGAADGTSAGDASIRAESICGVTTGVAGISSGATVRVATVGWRGSLAQSFQLPATRR